MKSWLTVAMLAVLPALLVARAETRVVHGDPSKLPPPDLSRQIERKTVEDLQKGLSTRSVPVRSVETRSWPGSASPVTVKAWSGSKTDYSPRAIQVGAFEPRGSVPSGWVTKGEPFGQTAVATPSSPLDGRGEVARPSSVPAEAVELPPDLTPEDTRRRFRVTSPLVEIDAAGKRRERGQATTEREVAPVRVGSQADGGVRAPPGTPPPQKPAVLK